MKFHPLLYWIIPLGTALALAGFAANHYFDFWNIFFFLFTAALFGMAGGMHIEDLKKEMENNPNLEKIKEIERGYFDKNDK